jgi:predicted phosphodiesterase
VKIDAHQDGHHLVLHRHHHRRRVQRQGGALIVNPGECAGHMPGFNAVGVVDLEVLSAEVLFF